MIDMAKVVFALSFVIGFAILAVAATGQQPNGLEARATDMHLIAPALASAHCTTREVSLDQGYGVSRKVVQRICPVAE
ncbi:MAG: hypothetical protein ABSC72_09425 [Methylovirgula sp.]